MLHKGGNCVAYRYAIAPLAIPKPIWKKSGNTAIEYYI